MSSKDKNVKVRTDRVVISVITLVILVALIVLIVSKVSNNSSNPSQSVNQTVQDTTTSTSDTTPPTDTTLEETTTTSQSGHNVEVIDGCTYIDGILIINKSYSASPEYQGYNGGLDDTKPTPPIGLFPEVIESFNTMQQDAKNQGLDIYIASGYRSYYTTDTAKLTP